MGVQGFPVVPLGNRRGTGYANVLSAARRCHAGAHFLAPYGSELRRVTCLSLWRRAALETALLALARPLAALAAALLVPDDAA